ncbi:MAG: hypothetical protein DMF97_15835 [Acidobacteria bacterium]|nr:MAG: hypothetical protein DMF97_15835 [Acidobacteriota bacterium]
MSESGPFRRTTDALDSWTRVGMIVAVIVLNGIWEETLILRAEFMMLVRWTRDVLRYDVRWTVQEKMRLLAHRRTGSMKE